MLRLPSSPADRQFLSRSVWPGQANADSRIPSNLLARNSQNQTRSVKEQGANASKLALSDF